jgi:hypothetical protein
MMTLVMCPHMKQQSLTHSHYYNTTYNITYSDSIRGRFSNAFSLTNAIGLFSMRLKYNFILESSNIVL